MKDNLRRMALIWNTKSQERKQIKSVGWAEYRIFDQRNRNRARNITVILNI